jgi:UDP-glucose 4-epimerase
MSSLTSVGAMGSNERFHVWYRNRRVLVVGADGFLGFNCVRALARLQSRISVATRTTSSKARTLAERVFEGDISNPLLARRAVEGQDVVIDLAGSIGAVPSNQRPVASLEQDCRLHLTLFEACADARPAPIVLFASSRLVYGRPIYLPVNEQHPLRPQSMYAVHKITVENYLQVIGQRSALPYCIFRLSNPYGPYQSRHSNGYGVLNRFLGSAAHRDEIVVYGDGRQIRDYIFVEDVIAAFLLAATEEKCFGETLNLGGKATISLADAARQIAALAGNTPVSFRPWPVEARAVETGDYCTDSSRLHQLMDLPPPTPWREGLSRSLDFYRNEAIRPMPTIDVAGAVV